MWIRIHQRIFPRLSEQVCPLEQLLLALSTKTLYYCKQYCLKEQSCLKEYIGLALLHKLGNLQRSQLRRPFCKYKCNFRSRFSLKRTVFLLFSETLKGSLSQSVSSRRLYRKSKVLNIHKKKTFMKQKKMINSSYNENIIDSISRF